MRITTSFNLPSEETQCQFLLTIIGPEFVQNESNWRFVGECLKNVLGRAGLEILEPYTSENLKEELNSMWIKLPKSRYGLASLKILAERQDKEKYQKWCTDVVWTAAIGSLKKTAGMTEIADIAKFLFGHLFVCTNAVSQTWWSFNGTCWERVNGGSTIKQKFSREMAIIYEAVYDEISTMDQEEDSTRLMTKKAAEITKGLKDQGFKISLMKECAEICEVKDFESQMDEDHYLMGLPNGILDMRDFSNIHLRPSYPDDWISLQTHASYRPDIYSWDHEDVKFVMNFKRQILTDDATREFSLKHRGSCLMGGNKDKLFIINIGETAHNGKTTDATFDRATFGSYAGKMPLGAISGPTPKANEVNPALVMTKGTRIQQIDEVSKKQEFNAAFMKAMCGNDEQTGRALYSNGITFLPQYNTFMSCNTAPTRIESAGDAGMDERGVLIPHESRFTSKAPESIEEQWRQRVFKANPHIKIELNKRIDAYLWILVEYLKKYLKEGLQQPQRVIEKTQKYQYSNNPYIQFKSEKLEITTRPVDYVALQDLYVNYKLWFADSYPGKRIENKESFSQEIEKVLGQPTGSDLRFHGIKLKSIAKHFNHSSK